MIALYLSSPLLFPSPHDFVYILHIYRATPLKTLFQFLGEKLSSLHKSDERRNFSQRVFQHFFYKRRSIPLSLSLSLFPSLYLGPFVKTFLISIEPAELSAWKIADLCAFLYLTVAFRHTMTSLSFPER